MANKAVLKECVVFQTLTEAELDRIADMCAPQDYAAGATVFSEGAPSGQAIRTAKRKGRSPDATTGGRAATGQADFC